MAGLWFRFPAPVVASRVAHSLRQVHPFSPPPVMADGGMLCVPQDLWDRPLVPEIVVGSGGRLVHPGEVEVLLAPEAAAG